LHGIQLLQGLANAAGQSKGARHVEQGRVKGAQPHINDGPGAVLEDQGVAHTAAVAVG
jgi:hypothetical protein